MPVNPNSILDQKNSVLQAMKPYKATTLLQCVVTAVNEQALTVSVSVPELSAHFSDVPISFPSKGNGYGSFSMPCCGASALLAIQDSSRKPYLLASFATVGDNTAASRAQRETLFEGEILHLGVGGGFLKADRAGQVLLGASALNRLQVDADGCNLSQSLGRECFTLNRSSLSGMAIPDVLDYSAYPQLYNAELQMLEHDEIISGLENVRMYRTSEFFDAGSGLFDYEKRAEALALVESTVQLIQGDGSTPGFAEILQSFTDDFRANLSADDFASKLAEVQSFINQYLLSSKGVKIVIDRGHVTDQVLARSEDALRLTDNDWVQSEQGHDLCFRFSLIDLTSNSEKAKISLDTEGNCLVNLKSLKIVTESYTLIEGG